MYETIMSSSAITLMGASAGNTAVPVDLTGSIAGYLALGIFAVAYAFVIAEETTHLRKSKPVVVAAGVLWLLVAFAWQAAGIEGAGELLRHNLLEYAELLLFLLAAMTFVNTIAARDVFAALRSWLVERGWSLRRIFWITGAMAFFLSPVLDNLTTALVMGAVVLATGRGNAAFIVPACINVVVAANAGGAFSPFGDITTLMVWQRGLLGFFEFFALFIPSLVNWLVPALLMSFAVPRVRPAAHEGEHSRIKRGGIVVCVLFALTVAFTVASHQYAHLPPFLGMMTGLGVLQIYGYFIRRSELQSDIGGAGMIIPEGLKPAEKPFDIFISLKRAEWDTLLFFYGVVLCVGALSAFGYLTGLSVVSYEALGATWTNVLVGLASAIIDNIPIMFAVLSIAPQMADGQWLLVTLTAGVGGSLLSIGSAAGVALMGQARGVYTFMAHLKWTWAVALGYAASIAVHLLLNATLF